MKKLILFTSLALLTFSCSNQEFEDTQDTSGSNSIRSATNESFTVERTKFIGGSEFSGYYVDAPGNLYGMYNKGYLDLEYAFNDDWEMISTLPYEEYYSGGDPIHDICVDINRNVYCITRQNYLLTVPEYVYDYYDQNYKNLTDKFPANTVFLGLTASQDNTNIFVITAQGDDSNDYWKSYNKQKVYRIAANGNVTEVVSNLQAMIVPNNNLFRYVSSSYSREIKFFTYTSILSKSQGAFAYGLSSDGRYYKVNVTSGEIVYYTPRTPIQHLTAGTKKTNPIALSGRTIIEVRPNQSTDIVIGTLPDVIEDKPVLFLSNADATLFYIVTMKDEVNSQPQTYRLKLNK